MKARRRHFASAEKYFLLTWTTRQLTADVDLVVSSLYGITCLLCGPGQLMTQGVQWPPVAPVTLPVTPSALNPHYCEEKQFPLFPL